MYKELHMFRRSVKYGILQWFDIIRLFPDMERFYMESGRQFCKLFCVSFGKYLSVQVCFRVSVERIGMSAARRKLFCAAEP